MNSRARPRVAELYRPAEDDLWCSIDGRETADEIVRQVTGAFADELAEILKQDRANKRDV
jgi:hypothetical protein